MLKRRFAIFFAVFSLLVFISSRINFSALVGAENQFFTLFQFFGPIAGGILGPFVGAGAVLAAQLMDFIVAGKQATLLNLLRITPMLFAAYYFGRRGRKLALIAPVIAILAFNLHPIGRSVWFFSLFWTIPLLAALFPQRLFLRSLGSTFTAHAVGGAIWVWAVPMTAGMWIALIPVVIVERTLFASGITLSYIGMTTLLHYLERYLPQSLKIDAKYVFSGGFLKKLASRL